MSKKCIFEQKNRMENVQINPLERAFFEQLNYSKIAVLVDENTQQYCYPILKNLLPQPHVLIQIQSGEKHKNLETCTHIWQQMTDNQFDRKSLLLNLGGGVIGDMGGFCASTYKRGIDFIQIPTTLLSQVDASVGGKLGIDFQGFKNHIGVFRNPKKVLIDTQFLKTLPERELRSGFAEVIKHCLIADKDYWTKITAHDLHGQNWAEITQHSVQVKSNVVTQDPTEKGLRKILNFGHTIGHAIETSYMESDEVERLLHGEAIAIGMICEAFISVKKGFITQEIAEEIQHYILKTYGQVAVREDFMETIIQNTLQDKKNEGSTINASLLKNIGDCGFDIPIDAQEIQESIYYYNSLF